MRSVKEKENELYIFEIFLTNNLCTIKFYVILVIIEIFNLSKKYRNWKEKIEKIFCKYQKNEFNALKIGVNLKIRNCINQHPLVTFTISICVDCTNY